MNITTTSLKLYCVYGRDEAIAFPPIVTERIQSLLTDADEFSSPDSVRCWLHRRMTYSQATFTTDTSFKRSESHYAREALALMREIGSLKSAFQAMFKLAQTIMLRGDLEEARALAEHVRDMADETNNLDSKMLSAGLLAFLICVMNEMYIEGAVLAQKNQTISLEPFFGGHNDLSAHWGRAIANCSMGHYANDCAWMG